MMQIASQVTQEPRRETSETPTFRTKHGDASCSDKIQQSSGPNRTYSLIGSKEILSVVVDQNYESVRIKVFIRTVS